MPSPRGDTLQRLLGRSSAPLVAQEVGGYLASFSGELARYPHFVGVVEDTNHGHWRYEVTVPRAFPVLSIARSPLEDIEDTLIGDAVAFSLERILRENFCAVIQGCHVGVLGYGKIGTSTAIAMRGRESAVSVYDLSPIRTIRGAAHPARARALGARPPATRRPVLRPLVPGVHPDVPAPAANRHSATAPSCPPGHRRHRRSGRGVLLVPDP